MAERPWYCWLRGEDRGGWAVGPGPGDAEVAICRTEEVARLVAAAPDLLAALRTADSGIVWRDDLQCWTLAPDRGPEFLRRWNQVRAAIARATGRPVP